MSTSPKKRDLSSAEFKRSFVIERWGQRAVDEMEAVAIDNAIEDIKSGKSRRTTEDDDTIYGVAYNETWETISTSK